MLTTILAVALRLAPDEVAIAWEAPEECPDVAHVRARIAEQLGGVEVEAARVRARVSAPDRSGAAWRLRIAIGDEGERQLEAQSCAALADAAVVMVAISLNASASTAGGSVPELPPVVEPAVGPVAVVEEPSPEPSLEPIAVPREAVPDPAASSSAPESTVGRWQPAAVIGLAVGGHGVGLPAPGALIGGRVGVRWGPLVVVLVGMHALRRERSVVDEVAASYQLTTGGLELGGVRALGRGGPAIEGFVCAEAEVGGLRAEGLRAVAPQVQWHPWVGVGGAVGAVWVARPWLAVGLRADLVAPLLGRQFVVGEASAGELGPVDARGALVLEFRAPGVARAR